MENSYGIGVANRYALFLDDDADPLEVLKVQEQEKELKKKSKVAEKENKGKAEVVPKGKPVTQRKTIKETPNYKPQENKRDETKIGSKPNTDLNKPERDRKFQNADNREERNNKRNKEDRPFNGPSSDGNREERPRREFSGNDTGDIRSRGRGGMGRPRGGRGTGRMFDQRGKREFDRQSGSDKTGVKPVDKREGGGAHNWGSHKDIIEEVDKNEIDPSWGLDTIEPTPAPAEVTKEAAAPEGETPAVEEEPKQFTLDEWKAQKANRQKPQYNLRKAGEGEDPTQWKKMYELSKKKEGEEEDSEDEEYDASEYPQRVGRQKHILDIDIHFNDARRGGTGGRGRGRSGPRGPRGGPGGSTRGERESRGERQGPRPFRGGGSGGTGGAPPVSTAPGNAPGGGGGTGADVEVEDIPSRVEHQHKGGRQNAPKVDDEHDFPSLS